MARYRKGIIAAVTAVLAVATQLLDMGVLSDSVTETVTIVVAVAGAVLTVLVPNAKPAATPASPERERLS